jgi:hypothetical protein
MTAATKLDQFTKAYIECALWSSVDNDGDPLDKQYTVKDLAPSTFERILEDCQLFQGENAGDIGQDAEYAGHDFWLTRNGHGAGFWDGDWPEPAATRLTASAQSFGMCELYIGDDGRIYSV